MIRWARLSPCGNYRYELGRAWGEGPQVLWVMVNPSTADADVDDATIRRCIGFSRGWGFGSLAVVNLFAYRSTDPKALKTVTDPIGGPTNVDAILNQMDCARLVVAAWGSNAANAKRPLLPIDALAHAARVPLRCLGRSKSGAPNHPLYLAANTPLEPYGAFE